MAFLFKYLNKFRSWSAKATRPFPAVFNPLSYFFAKPSSRRPNSETAKRLRRAESHNAANSTLYQLPTELLYLIEGYLEPLETMATRAASMRFMHLFAAPTVTSILQNRFRSLVRRSDFRAGCDHERQGRLVKARVQHLMCCNCLCSHSISSFSAKQQQMNPENRQCLGTTRVFQICPHRAVTFSGLETCDRDVMSCSLSHGVLRGREVKEVYSYRTGADVIVTSEYVLMRVLTDVLITHEDIAAALSKLEDLVCPHLRANDHRIPKRFADCSGRHSHRKGVKRPHNKTLEGLRAGNCSPANRCAQSDCDTYFYINRRRYDNPGNGSDELVEVVLCISRNLGQLMDAADPKWIAQTVDPATIDMSRVRYGPITEDGGARGNNEENLSTLPQNLPAQMALN